MVTTHKQDLSALLKPTTDYPREIVEYLAGELPRKNEDVLWDERELLNLTGVIYHWCLGTLDTPALLSALRTCVHNLNVIETDERFWESLPPQPPLMSDGDGEQ